MSTTIGLGSQIENLAFVEVLANLCAIRYRVDPEQGLVDSEGITDRS